MAKLSAFVANRDTIRDGEWIDVGTGENAFRIRTRGFTNAYRDGLNLLRRQAARDLNRTARPGEQTYSPDNLTPSADDQCQGQALADYCVLDVDGLNTESDQGGERPVTVDEFRNLLRDPHGRQGLLILAIGAAQQVGRDRTAEAETARGN